jgi:2-polyprenyl-3-methyl-5-hydroxy-6-metoxy-1,4-benzoquinol methylase
MTKVLGFAKRALYKLIIGPLLYSKKDGYNAEKYWQDRFTKYGNSIKGPGNEALSESENFEMYEGAKSVFLNTCNKQQLDFARSKVCEIGLGTGFYTQILSEQNVTQYKGFDIADVLITRLSAQYPSFKFQQKDVSSEAIEDIFDIVIIIDVVQHIVNPEKFSFAIENMASSLNPGGTLIIGPLEQKTSKKLFYVHSWTIEDVKKSIKDNNISISEPISFRNGLLYVLKKNIS